MKIGVSLTTAHPRGMAAREAGRNLVERARAIRAAGLDMLQVGDHHATPSYYFQNVPALARLAAETGEMPLAALFLAPLWHPVLLAEQAGTLAALSEGPLTIILAAGDGEEQFAAFGVPLRQRPSRLEEDLAIVRRLLAGERVSLNGRYHTLQDVAVNPVPPEATPIWIGASGRPALERAGALADGWLAAPGATGEELTTQADIYRQAAANAGRRPELIIRRDVFVGESDADAEQVVAPELAKGYRGMRREALCIGGPQTVADEFRYLASLGFTQVLVRHISPEQEQVLASYHRLGAEVLPRVRAS
ncbi:MAG TPA: LLM class flavin-dependent oxidoreductase [Dehalococcoidia bacterium]|nr:LLM class flavin-dependent oxidoreductase [Dehalococcoidia bacterium]